MIDQTAANAGIALMNRHIDALNKRDAKALVATLHFPHYRLSGVHWKTWESAERYFEDFLNRAGSSWSHSSCEDIRVIDTSSDKVHLDVEIVRFNNNNDVIARFRSLWVIINIDGVWAAKIRSSFAEK